MASDAVSPAEGSVDVEIVDQLVALLSWSIEQKAPGHEDVLEALLTFEEKPGQSFYYIGVALSQLEQHLRCVGDDEQAEVAQKMIELWLASRFRGNKSVCV